MGGGAGSAPGPVTPSTVGGIGSPRSYLRHTAARESSSRMCSIQTWIPVHVVSLDVCDAKIASRESIDKDCSNNGGRAGRSPDKARSSLWCTSA